MGKGNYYDLSSGGCALTILAATAVGLLPLLALIAGVR